MRQSPYAGGNHGPLIKSERQGVAQVLDDWAIPFSFRTSRVVGESAQFVARLSVSVRFAALLNTVTTPPPNGLTPTPLMGTGLL